MSSIEQKIKHSIREVVDFPKEGINFKDITPLLEAPQLGHEISNTFVSKLKEMEIDGIVGIESRGFLFGFHLAQKMQLPFILARKKGKLPYKTISYSYKLEYGTAEIEIHEDAIKPGMRILIHDDLLATGGTANAVANLVKEMRGEVLGFAFLIELGFLKGEDVLKEHSKNIVSLVKY